MPPTYHGPRLRSRDGMSPSCLAAQEPTFKTGISIVEIDAQVFDKAGIIDGLKQSDFAVTDDRQPVSLRYCVQEETPLDLLFLIELSKMMAPNRMKLRGAAEAAIAAMREGDRAGVLSFNEGIQIEAPLTADLKEVKRRVRTGLAYAAFTGKPFVLPAVAGAAKYLAAGPETHGRRAILMFGANAGFGLANQNHIGVAKDLWSADTILSAVVIPTSWTRFITDDNPYHIFGMMALAENQSIRLCRRRCRANRRRNDLHGSRRTNARHLQSLCHTSTGHSADAPPLSPLLRHAGSQTGTTPPRRNRTQPGSPTPPSRRANRRSQRIRGSQARRCVHTMTGFAVCPIEAY